jgi:exodeoxyribonuclease V alpha subunit
MKFEAEVKFQREFFRSNEGFTIAMFKVVNSHNEETNLYEGENITITGAMPKINSDINYEIEGYFNDHPKYGTQIQLTSIKQVKLSSKAAIIAYLSSGIFKGIGKKTATNIVDTLGEDAIDKIIEGYEVLLEVPKMSIPKAKKLHAAVSFYESNQKIIVTLTELGFTLKQAVHLHEVYDVEVMNIIRNNPYDLLEEFENLSFKKIDQIALNSGIDVDDPVRIVSYAKYLIKNFCFRGGHTYILKEQLIELLLSELYEVSERKIIDCLDDAVSENQIYAYGNKWTVSLYEDSENKIKSFFKRQSVSKLDLNRNQIIRDVEQRLDLSFSSEQQNAIINVFENNTSIITGGPGTGKTTVLKGILEAYKIINDIDHHELMYQDDIALVAPTGRAAKRMSEITFMKASTIHRLLKWNMSSNEFAHNEDDPLSYKMVIIDEMSMIDLELFAALLSALTPMTRIVLIGDVDQLPSVGPGYVLNDLISSGEFAITMLERIYRQSEDSNIISVAHMIRRGIDDESIFKRTKDKAFIEVPAYQIMDTLEKVLKNAIDKKMSIESIQVLAPMYKGQNGIDEINKMMQNLFNPPEDIKRERTFNDVLFREGDRVILTKNMPDKNVFNGDLGYIKSYVHEDAKLKGIEVYFDIGLVQFTLSEFQNIKMAYAMSIHKSQGSEFKHVIMPISNEYSIMLKRKILYTGITRAKDTLTIIGSKDALVKGIKQIDSRIRQTNLVDKLIHDEIKETISGNDYSIVREVDMEGITPYDFM